jgi:hypothetical protein
MFHDDKLNAHELCVFKSGTPRVTDTKIINSDWYQLKYLGNNKFLAR